MAKRKATPDAYYYIDGAFFDRMDGSISTRRKVERSYNCKLDKVVPYKDAFIGQTKKIYLKTKKR